MFRCQLKAFLGTSEIVQMLSSLQISNASNIFQRIPTKDVRMLKPV